MKAASQHFTFRIEQSASASGGVVYSRPAWMGGGTFRIEPNVNYKTVIEGGVYDLCVSVENVVYAPGGSGGYSLSLDCAVMSPRNADAANGPALVKVQSQDGSVTQARVLVIEWGEPVEYQSAIIGREHNRPLRGSLVSANANVSRGSLASKSRPIQSFFLSASNLTGLLLAHKSLDFAIGQLLSRTNPFDLLGYLASRQNPAIFAGILQSPAAPLSCPSGAAAVFKYAGNLPPLGAVPEKPDAPIASALHLEESGGALTLSFEKWPRRTRLLELLMGGEVIHRFERADERSFDVGGLDEFATYEFALRGANLDILGPQSEATAVYVGSEKMVITWLEPEDLDAMTGWQMLRIELADRGETRDECGAPQLAAGACPGLDVNDAELVLHMDGFALPGAPQLVSGTPRNGIYQLRLDTRRFADGRRELSALARASDCLRARSRVPVDFLNPFDLGARWLETREPVSNRQAYVSLQNEPLHPHPLRRYHVQSVVCDGSAPRQAWTDRQVDEADKNEAFESLLEKRAVELHQAGAGITPEQAQWRGRATLPDGASEMFWIQRWTPSEHLATHDSGEARVETLTATGAGDEVLVFARTAEEAPVTLPSARVAIYDGHRLALQFALTDLGLGAATSVAWMSEHRALYVVCEGTLFVVDLDEGEARLRIGVDGDARAPALVARVGAGEAARLWMVLTSASAIKPSGLYLYSPGSMKLLHELDGVATLAVESGGALYVAAGEALYHVDEASATLLHTFNSALTALAHVGADLVVGLSDGSIRDQTGALLVQIAAPVGAVAAWTARDGELPRSVAGADGANLVERLEDGSWSDARALVLPGDEPAPLSIDRVTALRAVERVTRPASGEPGQPGYISEKHERELLIGTATESAGRRAPLLVLRLAPPERIKGSFLSSKISHPAFEARAV